MTLLQEIFPTQGLKAGLPHCGRILYRLSHQGSPRILEWVAYPFSRGSSRPRKRTGVSCIADRFFTSFWATREALRGCYQLAIPISHFLSQLAPVSAVVELRVCFALFSSHFSPGLFYSDCHSAVWSGSTVPHSSRAAPLHVSSAPRRPPASVKRTAPGSSAPVACSAKWKLHFHHQAPLACDFFIS